MCLIRRAFCTSSAVLKVKLAELLGCVYMYEWYVYAICTYVRMYIYIDLITMENGVKVSPFEIEDYIKNKIPFLSNVMLIGDKRKYLTCLMTLKVRK